MKSKTYYNKIAKGYDELYGEEQLNKWKIAQKLIKFSKKDKILDIGCGTGLITSKIAKKVGFVIGLDNSEEMINHAKETPNIKYVVSDAKKLPYEDNSFSKVVSFTMIQDLANWNPVLKEIKRVSNGDILLTVQKRNKKISDVKKKLSKFFKIKKTLEEEKDFIFLLK